MAAESRVGRARRLLVDFRYGIGLARLVSRCPAGRSLRRLPTCRVWLSSGLRPRRAPWRGVAPEGIARLEVALPVLAVRGHSETEGARDGPDEYRGGSAQGLGHDR